MNRLPQIALLRFAKCSILKQPRQARRQQIGAATALDKFRHRRAIEKQIYKRDVGDAHQRSKQRVRQPTDAIRDSHRRSGQREFRGDCARCRQGGVRCVEGREFVRFDFNDVKRPRPMFRFLPHEGRDVRHDW